MVRLHLGWARIHGFDLACLSNSTTKSKKEKIPTKRTLHNPHARAYTSQTGTRGHARYQILFSLDICEHLFRRNSGQQSKRPDTWEAAILAPAPIFHAMNNEKRNTKGRTMENNLARTLSWSDRLLHKKDASGIRPVSRPMWSINLEVFVSGAAEQG